MFILDTEVDFFMCILFLPLLIWRNRSDMAEGVAGFQIHFPFGAGASEP